MLPQASLHTTPQPQAGVEQGDRRSADDGSGVGEGAAPLTVAPRRCDAGHWDFLSRRR